MSEVNITVQETVENVEIVAQNNVIEVNITRQSGSGGGAVDSVNGQTGDVVLDADDIGETATRFWLTSTLKTAYDGAVAWIITNGANLLNHLTNTSNPHNTTATQVDALKRDGSNANSDVDLGAFSLNAKSLHAKGTAGAGHLGLKHQSSNATASASETSLFAGSDGELYYKNDGNAVEQVASETFVNTGLATKENTITSGTTGQYYRGDKTFQTLNVSAVNGLQTALDAKVDKTNWVDISLTSTIVGWSSFTTRNILYKLIDSNLLYVKGRISGVSNSVLANITIPFTSSSAGVNVGVTTIVNNGVSQAALGLAGNQTNSNVINLFRDNNATAFTTTGTKTVEFSILIQL